MAGESGRIARALDEGLCLSDDGPLLLIHPSRGAEVPPVAPDRLVVLQPFRPDFVHWQQAGLDCLADSARLPPAHFAATIVYLPRARGLAMHLLAMAEACARPGGTVVLDGAKHDGIDSIIRGLAKERPLTHRLAKSHGKLVAWQAGARPMPGDAALPLPGGLVTRTGIFSADGPDPGSAVLAAALPALQGRVADLGAGWGYLSHAALNEAHGIEAIDLVEADWRALEAAKANLAGHPQAGFFWEDAPHWRPGPIYDSVLCNPPFHTSRRPDPALGHAFIDTAAAILKPSGSLYLVANRHLPYEAHLKTRFKTGTQTETENGYKLFFARFPITRQARPGRG